jgi:hypothetical protein
VRVGVWLKRASYILLVVACLRIAVEIAEVVRNVAHYWAEPQNTQEEYDRIAEAVARRFAADSHLPDVTRPTIRVSPDGPDLKIEAGYLTFQSSSETSDKRSEYVAAVSDYKPGGYRLGAAPNAYVVVEALTAGMDEFLAQRIHGHQIEAEVLGNADGLPIRSSYVYSGDLGNISDAPYYSYNTHKIESMTLTPNFTRHSNDFIAFLRALDVLRVISQSQYLSTAKAAISTNVSPEIGGVYRRVILRVTIKDALGDEYNEIPSILRPFVAPNH